MQNNALSYSLRNVAQEAGFNEHNDCAVRAVANSANIPYAQAHAMMKLSGRKDRKATYQFVSQKVLKELGAVRIPEIGYAYESKTPGTTYRVKLKNFCKRYPLGRYWICYNGHALAVVDGVVHDSFKSLPGRLITEAWKVPDHGQKPWA